jgi:putative transposase
MKLYCNQWAIVTMTRVLDVSTSGYYTWLKRKDRGCKTAVLDTLVYSTYIMGKKKYGYRNVCESLKTQNYPYSYNTVQRSMQRQGLRAKLKRKFKKTTDSNHTLPIYPNILNRDFTATRPNQKWVGDITYVWTKKGWVYLAQYLDLCTHKVVGWAMSENIDAELACNALREALIRENYPMGVLIHTDRGSTYCANVYREMIENFGCIGSMSRKGNCWDNAVAESFFGILKRELDDIDEYFNLKEAYDSIFEFIEGWYNPKRQHSTIGYKSPLNYEKELLSSHQQTVR